MKGRRRIRSMTGFGKGQAASPYGVIVVEIKTLNHKSLSISCAPFEGFFLLEERLKGLFEKEIVRGKVFVKLSREDTEKKRSLKTVRVNEDVIAEYIKRIKLIQKKFSLEGEVRIQDLLNLSGAVELVGEKKEERVWPYVRKAAGHALGDLMKYREREGGRIARDFSGRLRNIKKAMQEVKRYQKKSIVEYRTRLSGMIKKATKKSVIDQAKLEEEVALFARNYDIAEEVNRLEGHIEAYGRALGTAKADIGKKLDFIAQEMHRETNTIGSKAGDYRISNAVIEIKSEIEKIREQLKNIE